MKPRGTKDIFGKKQNIFAYVNKTIAKVASSFNFNFIETPIFEFKTTYTKIVGQQSDIVSKEMYVFQDKKGREFALRPEGTAGIVRAVVENKLLPLENNLLKLFYNGKFFRYERPQKNRQREFHQAGFEVFGAKNFLVDVEVILLGVAILKKLKIPYKLQLNSLGSPKTINKFTKALTSYFDNYKGQLSEVSLKRIETNPLRILDDKIENQKKFVQKAPLISSFYSLEEKVYFQNIVNFLKKAKVDFEINPLLVRGLDYYTDTTFEFIATSQSQKAKDTLIGGGRYDNVVSSFSNQNVSGIGFGIGIERLVNEIEDLNLFEIKKEVDFFVLSLDENSTFYAFEIAQKLRQENFKVETNITKTLSFAKGVKKANKLNAKYLLIVDQTQKQQQNVTIKTKNQKKILPLKDLENFIKGIKNEDNTQ